MSADKNAAVFAAIVQRDAPAAADLPTVDLLTPDSDVRLEAGLEALSENTRRVYGAALRSWGLWAAVHGVDALAAPPRRFPPLPARTRRRRRRYLIGAAGGVCPSQAAGALRRCLQRGRSDCGGYGAGSGQSGRFRSSASGAH